MEDLQFERWDQNFEVAFHSNFSDRLLRIEILAGPPDSKGEVEGSRGEYSSITEWWNRKFRREEFRKDKGNDIVDLNEMPRYIDCDTVLRVKTISISSATLAAKSPFFYKLFSNGVQESDQRHATLRINASEEAAVLDLLSFMHDGKLTTTSATGLLDVLMAADKFEVGACMRHCSHLLRNIPMTAESASVYLELPSSVSMASAIQPLTAAAEAYLTSRYRDITKFREEVKNLRLAGIEAILSSDDLLVADEDTLYDFVLGWVRDHYPKLEDQREIFGSCLCRRLRFAYMSCRKLREVLTCNVLDHDVALEMVLEALFFKGDTPHGQRADGGVVSASRRFMERAYEYRPVKVVELERPYEQSIVYLDLKREECLALFPGGRVSSQAFHLGGHRFFLSARCQREGPSHCFGLYLKMQREERAYLTVDYEFAARTRPSGEFVNKCRGYHLFIGGAVMGYPNLFQIPWTGFLDKDSQFFMDGKLHLRAKMTILSRRAP